MKKSFVYLVMTMFMLSCGSGSQNRNIDNAVKDSTENTQSVCEDDVVGTQVKAVELSKPIVKAIEFTAKNEYQNADFYYTTITAHIELEDGEAYVKCHSKCVAQYSEEVIYDNTTIYEGSWKSISVKRGNNYINAYDIECDNKDGHMEIYTTEKFDYMFCNLFSDDTYWKFHEGQTKYARKITDKRDIVDEVSSSNRKQEQKTTQQQSVSTSPKNSPSTISYEVTSSRVLTEKDIAGLSKEELRIIRNEIYARHGYIFKTDDMKAHFSKQSWYKASKADVSAELSSIENQNVQFLKAHE